MEKFLIFGILSLLIIAISWRTIFNTRSHGFYRFLSWECIAWLLASNYPFWFKDPFTFKQIISWILLIVSVILVAAGTIKLKKAGKPAKIRNENGLYDFEQTTHLVDNGIFKYIRHPLYSSLLFLTWGIFFKEINVELLIISVLSSIFLYITALYDEKECIEYFGIEYKEYMKKTRRFIPYLF